MSERRKFRLGFYVEVEAEGLDSGDAFAVASGATRWPWARHHKPLVIEGRLNGNDVTATIRRAELLMAKPTEEE